MKVKSSFIFFIFAAVIPLGVIAEEFEDLVAFDITLESLSNPSVVAEMVRDGRIVILEGVIGPVIVSENDEVLAELIGGAWKSFREVLSFRCLLSFRDVSWPDSAPPPSSAEEASASLPSNSRLLVAARVTGTHAATGYPMAEVVKFRVLD